MDKEMETVFLAGIKAMKDQSRGFHEAIREQTAAMCETIAFCRELNTQIVALAERITVIERQLGSKAD